MVSLHFEIAEAENGCDALEKINVFHPDLILLDWVMPIMDGEEYTHKIRQNSDFKTIPIIDIENLHLFSGDDINSIHNIFINANGTFIKKLRFGDGGVADFTF